MNQALTMEQILDNEDRRDATQLSVDDWVARARVVEAEVDRQIERSLEMQAGWVEKSAKDEADNAKLVEALFDHRADLHCYSKRPCPTCRNSAEVLGITNKVPYTCAREETDSKARAVLKQVNP